MWTWIRDGGRALWTEEEGLGTLEMILIIAVLVAVVLVFKDEIVEIVKGLLKIAEGKSQKVFED